MITLGGVLISDNMYLSGREIADSLLYDQKISIGGESSVRVLPLTGGRTFSLGTQNRDGATQGLWCKSTIDQIKALQSTGIPLILNYKGDMFDVHVISTADLVPFHQFEEESPTKKFVGKITLLEV